MSIRDLVNVANKDCLLYIPMLAVGLESREEKKGMKIDRRKGIDRREFIKAGGNGLATLALLPHLQAETARKVALLRNCAYSR
jgi:hypothetical protein